GKGEECGGGVSKGGPGILDWQLGIGTHEPAGGNEPDRCQTDLVQRIQATPHSTQRCLTGEGEELTLPGSPTPCAGDITPAARQTVLVVTLAMQDEVGSASAAIVEPLYKGAVGLERPGTMPVRDHEKRRHDSAVGAVSPERLNRTLQRRRDIMDRNEEHQARRMLRYTSKIPSNT